MTVYALPSLGILKVSGKDAAIFLQGQLSCDVLSLELNQSVLGCCCTPQGRVQSLFRVFRDANHYYLRLPKTLMETTLQHLKKYAIFSKVVLSDDSEHWQIFGSDAPLAEWIGYPVLGNRFEYYLPNETVMPIATASEAAWHLLEIKAGIPRLYPETVNLFTPHDLNLPALGGVNFQKGCYTGQEIVARMEHRGKLKHHLELHQLPKNSAYQPGQELQSPAGILVDHALEKTTCWGLILT